MSAYPNYYPGQIPMNQPPYQNFSQPMTNPYVDRMAQYQQYQQNLQNPAVQAVQQPQAQPGLIGRAVGDFSEIKPDDVPMNGMPAIFVKNDMSEIEVRVWCKDGLIRPTTYKPVPAAENGQAENSSGEDSKSNLGLSKELIGAFMGRFDDIAGRIERIEKAMAVPQNKNTNQRDKKEAGGNERNK